MNTNMLNLWVCDDFAEHVEDQPEPECYVAPQSDSRWEPYPTNTMPAQTAGSIYGNESTSTDARLLQVPVVSTGGSVLDARSRDFDRGSAAGSIDMPSIRNFYKRAQLQQQQQQQQQSFITAPAASIIGQNYSHNQQTSDGSVHSSHYNHSHQYQQTSSSNYYSTNDYSSTNSGYAYNTQYNQTQPDPATCSHYSYNEHEATQSQLHYGNGSAYDFNQHETQPQSQSHYGTYANLDTQWSDQASQYQYTPSYNHEHGYGGVETTAEEPVVTASPSKEDSAVDSTQEFLEMYHSLCLFSKTYGHTNVPKVKSWSSWFLLGSWVEKLRKRKKFQMLKERGITLAIASNQHPPLSDHELSLLEDIAFDWNAPSEEENDKILAEMKEIDNSIVQQASSRTRKANPIPDAVTSTSIECNKDSDLPSAGVSDLDSTFSLDRPATVVAAAASSDVMAEDTSTPIHFSPLKCKRSPAPEADVRLAKKNRKSKSKKASSPKVRIPKSSEATVNEVSAEEMEGETDTMVEQMWNAQFKKLAEFKKVHGNCAVPARNPDDPKLGHWVMTQRRQYHLRQKNKPSRMTKERIEMLEQLDFQWTIRMNPKEMWNMRLQQLVEYKDLHGDCLVPQRYNENPQLGTWVNTQRRHYKLLTEGKKSCMTAERQAKLNEVGFSWSTSSVSARVIKEIEPEEVEDDITVDDLDFM